MEHPVRHIVTYIQVSHPQYHLADHQEGGFEGVIEGFRPLGLLSPITVQAKIFMQSLWQHNLDRDEPLSDEDQQQWLRIAENIEEAKHF